VATSWALALLTLSGCLAPLAGDATARRTDAIAHRTSAPSWRLSSRGYGPATWGLTLANVEYELHVIFHCQGGPVPGICPSCPSASPGLPVTLVFGPTLTLAAVFTTDLRARTPRGIGPGSSSGAVKRAYPRAALVTNGALTAGLSTYYIVRQGTHALVFTLSRGRELSLLAFQNGSARSLSSELCA